MANRARVQEFKNSTKVAGGHGPLGTPPNSRQHPIRIRRRHSATSPLCGVEPAAGSPGTASACKVTAPLRHFCDTTHGTPAHRSSHPCQNGRPCPGRRGPTRNLGDPGSGAGFPGPAPAASSPRARNGKPAWEVPDGARPRARPLNRRKAGQGKATAAAASSSVGPPLVACDFAKRNVSHGGSVGPIVPAAPLVAAPSHVAHPGVRNSPSGMPSPRRPCAHPSTIPEVADR